MEHNNRETSMHDEERSASASMQDVRNYLREVRFAFRRTEVLCERAEKYRTLAMRATGRTDALRVSGTPQRSKVETYVLELVDTHAELQKEINELLSLSREAEAWIKKLDDDRYRAVLQLRYLCAMTWEEVADKMKYNVRWTHKMHREAVEALARIWSPQ